VAQTWDKNGNLTQDNTGATYAYDSANRLKTLTQGTTTSSYVYNGLGDQLQQTVSGVTTYTLDLTAGLTQVLADGTNTYLYGNGRIAQNSTANGKQYFLGDALGFSAATCKRKWRGDADAELRALWECADEHGERRGEHGV
jgi:hypothetical protein